MDFGEKVVHVLPDFGNRAYEALNSWTNMIAEMCFEFVYLDKTNTSREPTRTSRLRKFGGEE